VPAAKTIAEIGVVGGHEKWRAFHLHIADDFWANNFVKGATQGPPWKLQIKSARGWYSSRGADLSPSNQHHRQL